MKISRFFTKYYASTVDRQLSIASFGIAAGESIVSLANFVKNLSQIALWLKNTGCVLPPQEDAIFVGTQWSHMLERLDFAIAWPSLGLIRSLATKASEEDGFPEIRHCCAFYRVFRTILICPIMLQKNEGLLKETTESAPTPQFSTSWHREA